MRPDDSLTLVPPVEVEPAPLREAHPPRTRPDDQASLRWHLRVLRAHRGLAATVLLLVLGSAAAFIFMTTPVYEARVKLLIEADAPNVVTFKEVVEQDAADLDRYETELGMLRSRSLARKTIDACNLWNVSELSAVRQVPLLSFVSARLPSRWRPLREGDETTKESRTIDAFLSRLTLSYRADNRLVDVRVRSEDPHRAAEIANTLVRIFIAEKIATRLAASKAASVWLQARVAEQAARVQVSEAALQHYRERNPDLSVIADQNVVGQKLADLSAATTRTRMERIEVSSLYTQLRAIQENPEAFDTLPANLSNGYLQQLKSELAALQREAVSKAERLGERHPDMIRLRAGIETTRGQLMTEVATIADATLNQKTALEIKEGELVAALEAEKRQLLGSGRRAIEYEALEREATSDRQIFEGLLLRTREVELSSELNATNVQVVDPAELPEVPVSPRTTLILLLALIVGAPLAVGSAMAREYFDDRIKSPDEISANLGVRFLGFVPTVPRRALAGMPLLSDREAPEFAEALRGVRAGLLMGAAAPEARLLLITSTGPGEGKTLVASNLAAALAASGRRVLLIDADMRRARIHKLFGVSLEPGLFSALQGTQSIDEAVRRTSIPGLSILTAGEATNLPDDLLQQHGLSTLIAPLLSEFDWIVFDSPPVMVASEVMVLARTAAAVVFVIGAHMITVRDAKAALDRLAPSGAQIVGAVLSRSHEDRRSPYSYTRYYKSYHQAH
jgi:capsular exopolysaccharide synthesis family protein